MLDFVSNTDSLLPFPLSEESSSSLKTGYDVQGMMSGHQAVSIWRDEVLFVATPLGHGDCILSSGLMPNTEHSSVLYVQKCDIVVDKPGRRR